MAATVAAIRLLAFRVQPFGDGVLDGAHPRLDFLGFPPLHRGALNLNTFGLGLFGRRPLGDGLFHGRLLCRRFSAAACSAAARLAARPPAAARLAAAFSAAAFSAAAFSAAAFSAAAFFSASSRFSIRCLCCWIKRNISQPANTMLASAPSNPITPVSCQPLICRLFGPSK
ncbi:MAG: hypothetical protein R3F36_04825 [Candidatus Competibacteraceae bacterium]